MSIKVLRNFILAELIDKETYEKYKEESLRFLRPSLLQLIQKLRCAYGAITINNWHIGGEYNWSGLRTKKCPEYRYESLHTWSGAADLKFKNATIEEVRLDILENRDILFPELTGIELLAKTWLHIDTRFSKDNILVKFSPK